MSALRARCPDCRTLTAVAIGPDYQCHACGREFAAGLVRVPRAWGYGGRRWPRRASMSLPWPEAAVVEEDDLDAQHAALQRELPERPLVLGGCCCSHVGAVRELARRCGRVGVVWLDAHGDLNTPASSPSGNAWGMPLRMLLDADDVGRDVASSGRAASTRLRRRSSLRTVSARAGRAPGDAYVALDRDVARPGELDVFLPEPGGTAGELEKFSRRSPAAARSGIHRPFGRPRATRQALTRLGRALGF